MSQDIEAILRSTIQTKVIEAFNTTPDLVEKMVRAAFEKEVDQYGMRPERYGSEKMPWLEWLVGEEIRKAASEAIKSYVSQHQDEIRAKVSSAITNGDFGNKIGERIAEIMAEEYRWSFTIAPRERD